MGSVADEKHPEHSVSDVEVPEDKTTVYDVDFEKRVVRKASTLYTDTTEYCLSSGVLSVSSLTCISSQLSCLFIY